jgi:hypothetical protein
MAGRKVRDEREARAILEEAQRAGVAPGAVARRRGIDGRSMNAWRMTLTRSKTTSTIVELVAKSEAEPVYRVCVEDLVIEVDASFEEDVLARLINLARAC